VTGGDQAIPLGALLRFGRRFRAARAGIHGRRGPVAVGLVI
jgi:hypothetical protein